MSDSLKDTGNDLNTDRLNQPANASPWRWTCVLALAIALATACADDAEPEASNDANFTSAPDSTDAETGGGGGDDGSAGNEMDASSGGDAGTGSMGDAGTGGGGDDGDAGSEPDVLRCQSDADCNDDVFCNGVERCIHGTTETTETTDAGVDGYCVPGQAPCLAAVCSNEESRCDCDYDNDGEQSVLCGGTDNDEDHDEAPALDANGDVYDCDDRDPSRAPEHEEMCDPLGVDEDCNMGTVANSDLALDPRADGDRDGFAGGQCFNRDPLTAVLYFETNTDVLDCDDGRALVNPDAEEECSVLGLDEDCDGQVDEDETHVPFGLRTEYCVDQDGDGYSTEVVGQGVPACVLTPGYTVCSEADNPVLDCDDNPGIGLLSQPGRIEECDGLDNDCDGNTDERGPDQRLADELAFEDTQLECQDGNWIISSCPDGFAWCEQPGFVNQGCSTDITTRDRCGGCAATDCGFACTDQQCETMRQVSVGYDFACAATSAGRASCWGRGRDGRLGDDRGRSSAVPTLVVGVDTVVDVGAGEAHACALNEAGEVYCWGDNQHWQVSDLLAGATSPVANRVGGGGTVLLSDVTDLSVGANHACARLSDGRALCWGDNRFGQLGDYGTAAARFTPTQVIREVEVTLFPGFPPELFPEVATDILDIQAGRHHTCLLNDGTAGRGGEVECWGSDTFGAVTGIPATDPRTKPVAVGGLPTGVSQLAVGRLHSCALASGRAYCWGDNSQGQLGPRPASAGQTAMEVAGVPDLAYLAAGFFNTCGLTAEGALYCWGRELPGEALSDPAPRLVATPATVKSFDIDWNLCLLTVDDLGYCLGTNEFGQNGTGSLDTKGQALGSPIAPLDGSR